MVSNDWIKGTSRPSIQITGSADSLPWSCHVQAGVSTKSPGAMGHCSPSTVVYAPCPCMMKRMAVAECRWAGAHSPGSRSCTAVTNVWVVLWPATPGLASCRIRRSAPRPGVISSPACLISGSMSAQRHRKGSTHDLGAGDDSSLAQGALRCARSTAPMKLCRGAAAGVGFRAILLPPHITPDLRVQTLQIQRGVLEVLDLGVDLEAVACRLQDEDPPHRIDVYRYR